MVRTLEKKSLDSLIQQLLEKVGDNARVLGPGGRFSPLDTKFVGVLKQLLADSLPGIPEPLLSSVREDLIVVTRAVEEPSSLVSFGGSTMRLAKGYSGEAEELRNEYEDLLNVEIKSTKYVETDLSGAHIVFNEMFFAERSIKGWAKLGLYFARLTASMEDLARRSGLKPSGVSHGRSDSRLVYTHFEDRHGEEVNSPF